MEPAGLWFSCASSLPVTAFLAERATLWAPWAAHLPTPATLLAVLVSDDPSGCSPQTSMVICTVERCVSIVPRCL